MTAGPGPCPVCGGRAEALAPAHAHPRARCRSCELEFCLPFSAADAGWYEAAPLYAAADHPADELRALSWEQGRVLARAGAGARLLDLGCGGGDFLRAALARGLEPTGLDVQERQLAWAAETAPGARLLRLTLEQFAAAHPSERFDLVTAFHVLEHLAEPSRFLARAAERLRPGGMLAVAVPNRERLPIDGAIEALDVPPHHVTYWSGGALARALGAAGLDAVEVERAPVDTFGPLTRLFSTGGLARLARGARGAASAAAGAGGQGAPAGPGRSSDWRWRAVLLAYRARLHATRALALAPNRLLAALGAQGNVLLGLGRRPRG